MRFPTGFWFFIVLLLAVAVPSWGGDLPGKCGAGLRSQRVDRFTPLRPAARRAAYRVAPPVVLQGANIHVTEHFRVIWGHLYDPFDPQWADPDGDGLPTWVQVLAASLESSLATQRALGFPDPYGLDRYYLDAYVANTGLTVDGTKVIISSGYYAYTEIDPEYLVAYFVFHRDFSAHTTDELNVLRATAAHELFHAVQRVDYPWDDEVAVSDSRWQREGWWFEATATWVEELCEPGVNDYVKYVKQFLARPEDSLTLSDGSREYGAAIFPGFLWLRPGGGKLWRTAFQGAFALGLEPALRAALAEGGGPDLPSTVAAFWALAATPEDLWPDGALYRSASSPRLLRTAAALPVEVAASPQRFGASLVSLPAAPEGLSVELLSSTSGAAWRVAAAVGGSGLAVTAAPQAGSGPEPLLASQGAGIYAAVVNVSETSGARAYGARFTGDVFGYHSADWQVPQDGMIDLTELLRVIQLYNLGEFSCQEGSDDGFLPGPGDRTCAPHRGDYSPAPDWRFSLGELLRMIQLYNSGGYRADASGEDGFVPLLLPPG